MSKSRFKSGSAAAEDEASPAAAAADAAAAAAAPAELAGVPLLAAAITFWEKKKNKGRVGEPKAVDSMPLLKAHLFSSLKKKSALYLYRVVETSHDPGSIKFFDQRVQAAGKAVARRNFQPQL